MSCVAYSFCNSPDLYSSFRFFFDAFNTDWSCGHCLEQCLCLPYMMNYDTIHRKYDGTVEADGDSLVVDGRLLCPTLVT